MGEDGAADDSQTEERKERTEPGGGPKRVVSNRSVDDILESLDSTTGTKSNEVTDTVSEDTVSAGGGERGAALPTENDDRERKGFTSSPEDHNEREIDRDDEIDDNGQPRSDDEDLEARIDAGTVTGADVRAAETGDGREATPDINEIDLSLDDIDESPGTHHEPSDETDGPLAGRVGTSAGSSIGSSTCGGIGDESTADVRTESETKALGEHRDGETPDSRDGDTRESQDGDTRESQDDESTGLLDRLRRLF